MLCFVTVCYVTLRYVTVCYVMLRYVMLCYVMLCYVMLCYVMSTSFICLFMRPKVFGLIFPSFSFKWFIARQKEATGGVEDRETCCLDPWECSSTGQIWHSKK